MKERLIELLKEADEKTFEESLRKKEKADLYECTAEYLLAKGVIVPPCKVGDTVYGYWIDDGTIMIDELPIMTQMQAVVMKDLWGKKVFATEKQAQEAAEAKMAEKGGGSDGN